VTRLAGIFRAIVPASERFFGNSFQAFLASLAGAERPLIVVVSFVIVIDFVVVIFIARVCFAFAFALLIVIRVTGQNSKEDSKNH
jgi:hypothetical protein